MRTEYFALLRDMTLKPLGLCQNFCEADEKADCDYLWMCGRGELDKLRDEISRVLGDRNA